MVTISTSFSPTLHMRFAGSLSFFVTQALIGWAWLTCPSHTCSGNYKGKYLAFGFYGGRRLPSFTKWEFLEYKKGILLFSFSVVSDSLQPSGLQHTRLPCPLPSPRVCSNSCPLSRWCQLAHPLHSLFLLSSIFPSIRVFSNESVLLKYWSFSFSISPSNECSGLISFRTDWISLLSKGLSRVFSNTTAQKHQFFGAQLYGPTFTPIYDYWKNHSFD